MLCLKVTFSNNAQHDAFGEKEKSVYKLLFRSITYANGNSAFSVGNMRKNPCRASAIKSCCNEGDGKFRTGTDVTLFVHWESCSLERTEGQ